MEFRENSHENHTNVIIDSPIFRFFSLERIATVQSESNAPACVSKAYNMNSKHSKEILK